MSGVFYTLHIFFIGIDVSVCLTATRLVFELNTCVGAHVVIFCRKLRIVEAC